MTLILISDSYDSLYFCHVKKFDGTTLKTIYDMARPTKRQIAATAMAIAIVGGGGVVYADNESKIVAGDTVSVSGVDNPQPGDMKR